MYVIFEFVEVIPQVYFKHSNFQVVKSQYVHGVINLFK